MNDDLIKQANALLQAIKSTDKNTCICDSCNVEKWLPEMVAEIKRLQEQLVTWQQIAIDERARGNWSEANMYSLATKYTDCMNKDRLRSTAAKELGLQVAQEAGYLERLEAKYIEMWKQIHVLSSDAQGIPRYAQQLRDEKAQAALEKIRKG